MRLSLGRSLIVLLVVAALAVVGVRLGQEAIATTQTPGTTSFTGYVDVTAIPTYHFETPTGEAHRNVTLSFIVAGKNDPCAPSWGAYYTLDQADESLDLTRRIALLRQNEGDARVSFGGAANTELSNACTDPSALLAAYASVVDRYDLASIDLDIEGASLGSADASARRATAIKSLQDRQIADGKDLAVWLTLPVSPQGLTDAGIAELNAMLSAGVNLSGVNGLAMDFGPSKDASTSMIDAVLQSADALHTQVGAALERAGQSLDATTLWNRIGVTPMIGQNDVETEQFTIEDAVALNTFALTNGVGQLSMWSLNRDATCTLPTPVVSRVVKDNCSGIDQGDKTFHEVLSNGTVDSAAVSPSVKTATASATASASASARAIVDDPATSPFPIWDAECEFPAGTKIVWKQNVYQAEWWTKGFAPDDTNLADNPWRLVGPVLPGDKPAPLPTLPEGTFPQWDPSVTYAQGDRVLVDQTPYQAKWWTKGDKPGEGAPSASAWVLVLPPVATTG